MATKNFKRGIDNVFSPTVAVDFAKVIETEVKKEQKEVNEPEQKKQKIEYTFYNLKYPKELKKRILRFLVENDNVDIKDIFIEGAAMYLDKYKA